MFVVFFFCFLFGFGFACVRGRGQLFGAPSHGVAARLFEAGAVAPPFLLGAFPSFDDNMPPFRGVSRAEWGKLVKDPWSNGVCYLFFQAPGRLSPERDGWPGPGTPNSRGCIYITPLQGSAVNAVFSLLKSGRTGLRSRRSMNVTPRPRGHRLQCFWGSSESLLYKIPPPFL